MDWTNLDKVEFAITTHCQAKCPLCARTNKQTLEKVNWLPLHHLSLNEYKNAVDQLLPNKDICGLPPVPIDTSALPLFKPESPPLITNLPKLLVLAGSK